ncbi:DUF4166 domain-containing protein [Gymnodinialimonas hymeniacidonis]|uniref:DUF4166 domain-containing protein n=1 Tax=Gymnodinialimonas hymeniacidonis TaxID=3126508 RepID=UPI0034C65A33
MLYPTAMGAAFDDLPEALQRFHSVDGSDFYKGRVTVTHGNAMARMVAQAGGMPGTSGEMPFTFRMTRDRDVEIWERNFDGHMTRSKQWLEAPGIVAEQVGTSVFLMEPKVLDGGLHIPITKITGFGLPVPKGLVVSCEGVEGVGSDGAITFDVHAKVKGLGLIIRYQGEMTRFTGR